MTRWITWVFIAFVSLGCTGIPQGIQPVGDFQVERYLGKWYEIARLDHSFERGLTQVSAEYALREDGGLQVINRGYDATSGQWREAEGKAYFIGERDTGRLKVSFFGPFYGAYNIIALDRQEYRYVMICGADRSTFWILARTPSLEESTLTRLMAQAQAMGFATERLIYPYVGQAQLPGTNN